MCPQRTLTRSHKRLQNTVSVGTHYETTSSTTPSHFGSHPLLPTHSRRRMDQHTSVGNARFWRLATHLLGRRVSPSRPIFVLLGAFESPSRALARGSRERARLDAWAPAMEIKITCGRITRRGRKTLPPDIHPPDTPYSDTPIGAGLHFVPMWGIFVSLICFLFLSRPGDVSRNFFAHICAARHKSTGQLDPNGAHAALQQA